MKKISCFLVGFEPFGYFVGALLAESNKDNLPAFKKSVEFYNLISDQLDKFLELHEYSKENVSKWFNRYAHISLVFYLSI